MWSTARYDLGLTDAEFWRLTPRQYAALLKRHHHKVEHDEYMLAEIISKTVNFSFCHPEHPTKTIDFMPSMRGKKVSQAQTIERLKAQFRAAKEIGEKIRGDRMPDSFSLEIDTSDLVKRLEQLPRKVAKNVLIGALTDSGHVMQSAIKQAVIDRSPRGASGEPRSYTDPNGNSIMPELLAEDIDIDPYVRPDGTSCNVEVGPTELTGYVARWLNDGWMHVHGGRRFNAAKTKRGKGIDDEQIPGTHMFEAGFDESAVDATNVFTSTLAAGIEEAFQEK